MSAIARYKHLAWEHVLSLLHQCCAVRWLLWSANAQKPATLTNTQQNSETCIVIREMKSIGLRWTTEIVQLTCLQIVGCDTPEGRTPQLRLFTTAAAERNKVAHASTYYCTLVNHKPLQSRAILPILAILWHLHACILTCMHDCALGKKAIKYTRRNQIEPLPMRTFSWPSRDLHHTWCWQIQNGTHKNGEVVLKLNHFPGDRGKQLRLIFLKKIFKKKVDHTSLCEELKRLETIQVDENWSHSYSIHTASNTGN